MVLCAQDCHPYTAADECHTKPCGCPCQVRNAVETKNKATINPNNHNDRLVVNIIFIVHVNNGLLNSLLSKL